MAMMKVIQLEKSFGIDEIFKNVNFTLHSGERLGLVGRNGVGKSTLLKCLIGEMEADAGDVHLSPEAQIGYLQQGAEYGARTLREEIRTAWQDVLSCRDRLQALEQAMGKADCDPETLAKYARLQERFEWLGGYEYEAMTRRILHGLGFAEEDWDRPADQFSGGQKTRINLAKALVRRPDFLILDEPTNHLDIEMTEWLEEYLRTYRGGILIVSHDRYFLDALCTGILDLDRGKLTAYRGNYTKYMREKQAQREADRRAYEKQQEEIARTEEYIRRYKAGIKAKQARGRQSQLDRLERLEAPQEQAGLRARFHAAGDTADKVIIAEDLAADYEGRVIFRDLSLLIRRKEAVGIIGPNGIGKSTLLTILAGKKRPSAGRVTIGNRVVLGYYSQAHENLHADRTVLAEVMYSYGCGEAEARDILGAYLFRGDEVERRVGTLSGGEKARLALLLLILNRPNVIIMDEPTNHLDIPTREAIEQALADFGGTYVIVSHDRYFLDRLVRRILSFEDGVLREYHGNYSYWKEKRKELLDTGMLAMPKKETKSRENPSEEESRELRSPETTKVISPPSGVRNQERLRKIEEEIARTEATIKMYQLQIAAPDIQADHEAITSLMEQLTTEETKLEELYEKWEGLAD